jgi:hypothetical protein
MVAGIDRSDAFACAFGLAVAQQHGAVLAANQKLGGSSCGIVLQADASVHDAVTFIQHGAVA